MSNGLDKVHAFRKLSFHFWMDRLAFRGDGRNMNDRMLKDIGLAQRDCPRSIDPFFFI